MSKRILPLIQLHPLSKLDAQFDLGYVPVKAYFFLNSNINLIFNIKFTDGTVLFVLFL